MFILRYVNIVKTLVKKYIQELIDNDDFEEDFNRNYSKYANYYRKGKKI